MSSKTLRALRTKAEAECNPELGEVIIVSLPVRSVASFLRLVDAVIDASDRAVLSHLRRVVKRQHLPERTCQFILDYGLSPLPGTDVHLSTTCQNPDDPPGAPDVVYILVCRATMLQERNLNDLLQDSGLTGASEREQKLCTVRVPLVPPTTQEQASLWSEQYWPTIYKKHNHYGPQHNIITEATAEIAETTPAHMELASSVGEASCVEGFGVPVGAVVVSRSKHKGGRVIAVAGDARWYGLPQSQHGSHGNSMAHAALRVIGMVAKKRKALEDGTNVDWENCSQDESYRDYPITQLEMDNLAEGQVEGGGYLCLNLEIYMTHEPCVMCSMALLHSRFGKIVFESRMPSTGSLVAGDGRNPSYGLFWLPSLNWKLLAWQWIAADNSNEPIEDLELHA